MPWSSVISSEDVVAIHAAIVPTANGDGEILLFGGDNHDRAANRAGQWNHSRRFNCRHPTEALAYVQSPNADLFCCGHAWIGDGRLLTAGGTLVFREEAHGIHARIHFEGHRRAFTYNPATLSFGEVASMGFQPGRSVGGGRWYPTLLTLATGEVLAVAGHPDGDDGRHNNNVPERYQPLADRWVSLAPTGPEGPDPDLYPRMHLLRDGSVFVSSRLLGNARCVAIDPWTGDRREVCDLPDPAYHGFGAPAVLLPLTPEDGYTPRVLLCGGVTSQVIDLGASTPSWTSVPRSGRIATLARTNACATILPTGDVLMTGGADPVNDQSGVMDPELYSTPLDHRRARRDPAEHRHARGTPVYVAGPGSWRSLGEPATVLRNYHSTALLMPDGRVWTGGGNGPTQPADPPGPNQKKIEIFAPPYPSGARPEISVCPKIVAYGDDFEVQTPQAQQIRAVTLLRCGSVTHAFDSDQRCIFLAFATEPDMPDRLHVTAPPHGGVAPPGNYMLFLVDTGGRPCQYARFVRVGGRMSLFTDRSTISQPEVQALLAGPDPSIPDAVFVVLDGFTALAAAGSPERPFPPTVTFAFEDNGRTVPGFAADLSSTLYESPSAPSGVAQRITLGYRLNFTSDDAFDGIPEGEGRAVRVTARWGQSRATGRIMVYRRKHVYMVDGPVPWLSVDVQVMQLARGAPFAGVTNADPTTFIAQAITALRGAPEDASHPFRALQQQPNPTLELSDLVDGTPRDNFAFAKVRFRAPAGVEAAGVRVFFRMFMTAATTLSYARATYPRSGDGPNAVALPGVVAGQVVSQPFFAAARNPNPSAQQDPENVATLSGAGAVEDVAYFGAWLDFNHDAALRDRVRGEHQCLVAEVHFPPSVIPPGAAPADNDQLSQRNLVVVESENPGDAASHTVAHTFDLKSSEAPLPNTLLMRPFAAEVGHTLAPHSHGELARVAEVERQAPPDELFIRWHGLPRDSAVAIYLPGVDVEQVLLHASSRLGYGSLTAIDEHTIACRVGDATYLPLPGGRGTGIAGLMTIQLPPTVRRGETYRVSVHQVAGQSRSFVASFQLTIPVNTADAILPKAQRTFDVLRAVNASITPDDRWRPVFDRYMRVLGARLSSLGGAVEPGPPEAREAYRGKVIEILYDCSGDFQGFVLDSCGKLHEFHAREQQIMRIVELAANRRLKVVVHGSGHDPTRVGDITLCFD